MKCRQLMFLLMVLGAIGALLACGGGGSGTTATTPPPISVMLTGAPASLLANSTATLTATVSNDSTSAGVTWSMSCGSAGACGALSNTTTAGATYTAPAVIPSGNTVTVTATSVTDTSKSASASITITVISVMLGGAPASLLTNATAPLTATVSNDPKNAGVTWTVSCGSMGACGALSGATPTAATYAAPGAIPSGSTVTVTATSVTDTTRSVSASITITTDIVVTLGPVPTSLQLSGGAGITAFIANDSANAGVAWSVACGSAGACGSFRAANTASGITTGFSAPIAVPGGNTVTVTASSVTDATKKASASITITNPNTMLANGTYVFSLAGATGGGPYYIAGAFVVSGGSITGGEQDYIDLGTIASDRINGTGSALSTSADGNLQITLTSCNAADCSAADTNVGVNGVETLDAALLSSSAARIIEFDSSATSSGRVDLQTSTAALSAGYAFFTAGFDARAIPLAIGGVIDVDGAGTISGNGSVFDFNDSFFAGGRILQKQSFVASTVSTPDNFGRIVFSLFPTASVPAFKLAGYVVDSTHIRLVETSDSLNGTLGGIALGQGANTGAFSSISGNSYVAGLAGIDENGAFQAAGVFTANSASAVSGAMNYNDLIGTGPETPSTITGGTYTVDSTGRVTMTGVTDGIETFNLQIYLTGNGAQGEATAITVDENDVLAGLAWQQTGSGSLTASSLFGTYALDASGAAGPMTSGNELDAVGPIMADGVGNLTGTADRNNLSQGTATDLTVSGTFMANPDGAFTGRIMGLDITTSTNNDAFSYYLIDTTKVLAIETDGNQLTLGLFTLEQ